jgi:SOS-response transcriptional repressor LexA
MATVLKRKLTDEEIADAERLAMVWDSYKKNNPGTTQHWLAYVTGLGTQGSINQYLRGTIPLNHKALLAICDVIGVDPATISPTLSRTIPRIVQEPMPDQPYGASHSSGKFQKIPILSPQQACRITDLQNPYPADAGYSFECANNEFSPWVFALEIEDESMAPEFRVHDRILIDPKLLPDPGDFVVVQHGKQDEVILRKYKHRGKDNLGNTIFDLTPINDDYPTVKSDVEDVTILGVLIEHRKKYKVNFKK